MKTRFPLRHAALAAVLVAGTTAWAANQASNPELIVVAQYSGASEPITVEQRRLTTDGRIQADVMDRLRRMEHIEGLIGVETTGSRVTLTGMVTTSGQAYRAGRVARDAGGVGGVDNQIRSKVGATF